MIDEASHCCDRIASCRSIKAALDSDRSDMMRPIESRTADGDDILPYLRDHYELKNFLAECARNPFVARAVMPCYAMSRRFYYLHHRQARDLATATRHHSAVIRAVATGDEKRAAEASDKLMDYVEEFTRATQKHSSARTAESTPSRRRLAGGRSNKA